MLKKSFIALCDRLAVHLTICLLMAVRNIISGARQELSSLSILTVTCTWQTRIKIFASGTTTLSVKMPFPLALNYLIVTLLWCRRERGMCRICYSAAENEFDVSSDLAINVGLIGGNVRWFSMKIDENHTAIMPNFSCLSWNFRAIAAAMAVMVGKWKVTTVSSFRQQRKRTLWTHWFLEMLTSFAVGP